MIIDTHVHYDDEAFDADREELIGSLQENNIGLVLDIGSTKESLPKIRSLMDRYDFVYGAMGLHPDEIGDLTDELLGEIREDMKNPKVLAVGEIGLDYYWNKEEQELQKAAFRRSIWHWSAVNRSLFTRGKQRRIRWRFFGKCTERVLCGKPCTGRLRRARAAARLSEKASCTAILIRRNRLGSIHGNSGFIWESAVS